VGGTQKAGWEGLKKQSELSSKSRVGGAQKYTTGLKKHGRSGSKPGWGWAQKVEW